MGSIRSEGKPKWKLVSVSVSKDMCASNRSRRIQYDVQGIRDFIEPTYRGVGQQVYGGDLFLRYISSGVSYDN